jgi:NAD(P)-dependent dehydrogenase (short-subunit alcohol dehydrogenase family)
MDELILITGGSRGIGKTVAERLLEAGYRLRICARRRDELAAAAESLSELGEIDYSVLDLRDRGAIHAFCRDWREPLYGLINNAGIARVERLDENEDTWHHAASPWDEVLEVNLHGVHFLTKGLLRHLSNPGRIVNMSSQLGKEGRAGYGAYCASKFGLIGLTKCWAKELGRRGITVNAVCPGWVGTDQALGDMARIAREKGLAADDFYPQVCAPLELGRFITPREVANLVAFLISGEASGITGRSWLMATIWNQE